MDLTFDHSRFTVQLTMILDFNSDCGVIDTACSESVDHRTLEYLGRSFDRTIWRLYAFANLLVARLHLNAEINSGNIESGFDEFQEVSAEMQLVDDEILILQKLMALRIAEAFPEEKGKLREAYILVGTVREFCVFAKRFSVPPLR